MLARGFAVALAASTTIVGCMATNDNAQSVRIAVEERDPVAVQRAVAARRGLEERDESGNTPLLIALASGQFVIAEILIKGGADVWAHDEFGLTAGHRIAANPFDPGSVEGDAKQRVIELLSARGFPRQPPPQAEVLRLDAANGWPPRHQER